MAGAKKRTPSTYKPHFWPAMLMLAPVGILAIIGFIGLRHDRQLVAIRAQEEAEAKASRLAKDLRDSIREEAAAKATAQIRAHVESLSQSAKRADQDSRPLWPHGSLDRDARILRLPAVIGPERKVLLSDPVMPEPKSQVEDRVHGLDLGADDYHVKPFSTEELLARVRAVLRRYARPHEALDTLTLGNTHIDFAQGKAWQQGKPIHLTQKEIAMLKLLAESRGEVISRERFLDVVWGYTAFPSTRTADNHIAGLRAKLEPDPEKPRWLKTVHGRGYRLEEEFNRG